MRPFPSGNQRLAVYLAVSLTGILLAGAFLKSEAAAEDEGRKSALALLQRCLSAQAAMHRASFQVTADIVVTHPSSDVSRMKFQTRVLRDEDRMSITGTEENPDAKQRKLIRTFRFVGTPDLWVGVSWRPTATGPSQKTGGSFSKEQTSRRRMFANAECAGRLDTWLDRVRPIEQATRLLLTADGLRVRGEESIEGTACKVIEGHTKYGTITVWLAESKGWLPLKASHELKPTDTLVMRAADGEVEKPMGEVVTHRDKELGGDVTFTRMTSILDKVVVERIGEAFVPTAGRFTLTEYLSDGTRWVREETCRRSDINLAPKVPKDAFEVQLPDDSRMNNLDDRSGVEYVWRDGNVVLGYDDFSGTALGRWKSRLWLRVIMLGCGGVLLVSAVWLLRRNRKGVAINP